MRASCGSIAASLCVLCASVVASAQSTSAAAAAGAPRLNLWSLSPQLTLSLPAPAAPDPGSSNTWLIVPAALTLPPLIATTLLPTLPLQTANGELATYVAVAPLAATGPVSLAATGSAAKSVELDCDTTCQQQVENAVALEARVGVAGDNAQPGASVFVRTEQVSSRPNPDRRVRIGVLGAF